MPYIPPLQRPNLASLVDRLRKELMETSGKDHVFNKGQLNYAISTLVWGLFEEAPSYSLGADILSTLEAVKLEFYRRKLGPYEDEAIKKNGDI